MAVDRRITGDLFRLSFACAVLLASATSLALTSPSYRQLPSCQLYNAFYPPFHFVEWSRPTPTLWQPPAELPL